MDLLAAWLLFPVVALAVCWGLGLLVQRAAGELPAALLLPVGMAALVCATQLTTYWDWSAELTLPLVVLLTLAGFALGRRRLRPPLDPWGIAAVAGVFAVFAAPVVLSGDATFAGYTVLGDTSIHMIGSDALLTHGRDFSSLPPSSYEYSLVSYYGTGGYPSGGPTAVAALTSLVHLDVAWTFQPFLALLAALTGAALWSMLTPYVPDRRLRAALTFVASQPSLVLAYALQGSIKEVGGAWGIVLVAALTPVYVAAPPGPRRTIPLAVAAGALVGIMGLAAGVWLGPLLLVALVAGVLTERPAWRTVALEIGAFGAIGAVLIYQALLDLTTYVDVAGTVVTTQQEFGNLLGPLDPVHVLGVWLSGDYRIPPDGDNLSYTKILRGVVIAAVALGLIDAVRRRAWQVLSFLGISAFAYWYVTTEGSPWADGKAMMLVSPAVMFAAALGAAFLFALRRRVLAWVLTGLLALGVVWSNALQYHDASLAPRDRMEELDEIGDQFDGHGPSLYTESEEFAKHFLRDVAPEGSSEGWQRRFAQALGREGLYPRFGFNNELDQYTDEYVTYFRTIVLRRGYYGSRPSSIYRLVRRGRYYDVWQRAPDAADDLIRHEALGTARQPAAVPECSAVRAIARDARRAGGRIAYAPLPVTPLFIPPEQKLPRGWFVDPADPQVVVARGRGTIEGAIELPRAGRYRLWVEGGFKRDWSVRVDGREVAPVRKQLNPRLSAQEVDAVELPAGRHVVTLTRPGGNLAPGDGGPDKLGPVALVPAEFDERPAETIDPARWRSLCGESLDWVEAVR